MIVYEKPDFNVSSTMLKKIKAKEYFTKDGEIIPDLQFLLANFSYVQTQNKSMKMNKFIQQLAHLVEYEYYKEGQYIAEHHTGDTFFILKGEVIALEERSQSSIQQDHYWLKKLNQKKKVMEDIFDEKKRQETLEELQKIERTHKYFSDNYVESYLRADLSRYSLNFNIEGECMFKGFALLKSGIAFGKDSNKFLLKQMNLTKQQKCNMDYIVNNELKQRKVQFIAGKNLHVFRLKSSCHKTLYHDQYESKQRIIDALLLNLESLRNNQFLQDMISSKTEQMHLFEDQALYLQNSEKPTHIYLVINGLVEISSQMVKNSPVVTYIQGPDIIGLEFLGEQSQFRQYSARCRSPAIEIYKISYDLIKGLPENKQLLDELKELGIKQNLYYKQQLNLKLEQHNLLKKFIYSGQIQLDSQSPRLSQQQLSSPLIKTVSQFNKSTKRYSIASLNNQITPTHKIQNLTPSHKMIYKQSPRNLIKDEQQSQHHFSKFSTNDQLSNSCSNLKSNDSDKDKQEDNQFESLLGLANKKLKQYLISNNQLKESPNKCSNQNQKNQSASQTSIDNNVQEIKSFRISTIRKQPYF